MGAVFHSNGFGLNLDIAKFKTYKKKSLLHLELIMKHNKEYKMLGFGDESAKKYVYGKLNYVNVLRVGIGRRKLIFENSETMVFSSQPMLVQVYLLMCKTSPFAVINEISMEYQLLLFLKDMTLLNTVIMIFMAETSI